MSKEFLKIIKNFLTPDLWDLNDEYHRGMYNGLELARATFEHDEPNYIDSYSEQKIKELEDE